MGQAVGSSAAILWSFLAALMALSFGGSREAIYWLIYPALDNLLFDRRA